MRSPSLKPPPHPSFDVSSFPWPEALLMIHGRSRGGILGVRSGLVLLDGFPCSYLAVSDVSDLLELRFVHHLPSPPRLVPARSNLAPILFLNHFSFDSSPSKCFLVHWVEPWLSLVIPDLIPCSRLDIRSLSISVLSFNGTRGSSPVPPSNSLPS